MVVVVVMVKKKRGADSKKLQVAGFVDSGRKSATKLDPHVNSV